MEMKRRQHMSKKYWEMATVYINMNHIKTVIDHQSQPVEVIPTYCEHSQGVSVPEHTLGISQYLQYVPGWTELQKSSHWSSPPLWGVVVDGTSAVFVLDSVVEWRDVEPWEADVVLSNGNVVRCVVVKTSVVPPHEHGTLDPLHTLGFL